MPSHYTHGPDYLDKDKKKKKKTSDNFGYGDMTPDFKKRYKEMLLKQNKKNRKKK